MLDAGYFTTRRSLPGHRSASGPSDHVNGIPFADWNNEVLAHKRGVLVIDAPHGAIVLDHNWRDIETIITPEDA